MLRRRRRTPRDRGAAPPGAPPGSRRRPRPGAQVPSELLVKEPPLVTAQKPKAEARRGREKKEGVVLVTGFDAFCGEPINPSWEICERLPRSLAGLRVETVRLPCEFGRAIRVACDAIERLGPTLVVCLGQAGGRAHLSVERVAINVSDARVADNAGARPIDEAIVPRGPPAYFSTLPIKAMVEAMHATGVPAEVSNSAGTYVCNHVMYGVLNWIATARRDARAGFIHVPYAVEQVIDKPAIAGMSIETMVKGVEAAIIAAHRHATDIKASGAAPPTGTGLDDTLD
jgi:pyroglutamyl-peptidase